MIIAQIIGCGFCCEIAPEWLCIAFGPRGGGSAAVAAAVSLLLAITAAYTVQILRRQRTV